MSPTKETVMQMLEENMPSLSPTTSKIMQLANNINTSPPELTKVIKLDPVLSAKVLKLVNSSYFALGNHIVSLEKSVIMLGLNTIKNLAISAAALTQMASPEEQTDFDSKEFWKHSLAVGVTAKLIAQKRNVSKKIIEDYFIAGLLHDLGILIEQKMFPNEFAKVLQYSPKDGLLLSEEIEMGEMNHCQLGKILGERWKLSPDLIDVIVSHHEPVDGLANVDLNHTVYLANIICKNNNIGLVLDKTPVEVEPGFYEKIGLTASIEQIVLKDIESEINKAMEFLQV